MSDASPTFVSQQNSYSFSRLVGSTTLKDAPGIPPFHVAKTVSGIVWFGVKVSSSILIFLQIFSPSHIFQANGPLMMGGLLNPHSSIIHICMSLLVRPITTQAPVVSFLCSVCSITIMGTSSHFMGVVMMSPLPSSK